PFPVRDERAVRDARAALHAVRDGLVVGELRDPARRDEARELDAAEAGVGEEAGERDLVFGGDEGRLVLEAVSKSDLVDADALLVAHIPIFPGRASRRQQDRLRLSSV